LIVVALSACALARPDIGLKIREGYKYQPPATNYGVPTGSYLPGAPSNSYLTPLQNSGNGYHQSSHTTSFGSNGNGGNGGNYNGQATFSDPSVTAYQQSFSSQSNGYNQGGNYNQVGQGGHYNQGGQGDYSGYNQYSGQAQVHKHVYFYDSPEDLPAPSIRISGQASSAQKNYKIIFIKAPSYKAPEVPQIPIQQQNEEKTLVYVLVKKPDESQEIVVPTLAPSKPSKPEVFFIKYKTQKEAEAQIQQIQQGSSSGVSANSVDNDAAFVSTIKDTQVNQQHHGDGTSGGHFNGGNSDFNQHVFTGGNQHQQHGGNGAEHHQASSSSQTITGSGASHNYGPAGASGPY